MPPAPPAQSLIRPIVGQTLHAHGNWTGVRPAKVMRLTVGTPSVVINFDPDTDGLALVHDSMRCGYDRIYSTLPLFDNLDDYPTPTGATGIRAIISAANPNGWLEYRANATETHEAFRVTLQGGNTALNVIIDATSLTLEYDDGAPQTNTYLFSVYPSVDDLRGIINSDGHAAVTEEVPAELAFAASATLTTGTFPGDGTTVALNYTRSSGN